MVAVLQCLWMNGDSATDVHSVQRAAASPVIENTFNQVYFSATLQYLYYT